jgi:hypothetical protein
MKCAAGKMKNRLGAEPVAVFSWVAIFKGVFGVLGRETCLGNSSIYSFLA